MKIQLLAIGDNMPTWVKQGYEEYAKRLTQEITLSLHELTVVSGRKYRDVTQVKEMEANSILALIKPQDYVIALDQRGKSKTTEQWVEQLQDWLQQGVQVKFLIGGPDGLSHNIIKKAHQCWSLSSLTLPHMLVRVILAEQIYRAWSVLKRHPYHR